jgi:hypothetical protein
VVAFAVWGGSCGEDDPFPWFAFAAGLAAAGATYASVSRNWAVSTGIALVVGIAVSGLVFLIGLLSWLGNCTA